MLLLTREQGQSITVHGVGTLTVMQVRGGRVKIGFEFDPNVRISRSELPPLEAVDGPPDLQAQADRVPHSSAADVGARNVLRSVRRHVGG